MSEDQSDLDVSNPRTEIAATALDHKLLALLKHDSRQTASLLADRLGVSRSTVKKRMELLQKTGVIKQFTILTGIMERGVDKGLQAFFLVKTQNPTCATVFDSVSRWPELKGCWSFTGERDMLIHVQATDAEALNDLRLRLARHPEVTEMISYSVLTDWIAQLLRSKENQTSENQTSENQTSKA